MGALSQKKQIDKNEYFTAIDITFPVDVAEEVLCQMENIFGLKFQKMYGHIPVHDLIQSLCLVLNGITPFQLKKGIERLRTEHFCPSLSDFGQWCREHSEFWSEHLAWAKVLNFLNNPEVPITVLAKRALDEVRNILNHEGQVAAGFAFRAVYKDFVAKAIQNQETQVWWQKSKLRVLQAQIEPVSMLDRHSTDYHLKVGKLQQQYMGCGMTPKQALIRALKYMGVKHRLLIA